MTATWILLIWIRGFSGPVLEAIEFNSAPTCQAAAMEIEAQIKDVTRAFCVKK